tara:strand:+ start:2841 stop:3017 length:177 start_codon:yes stop_codon:yes gene_type:complete
MKAATKGLEVIVRGLKRKIIDTVNVNGVKYCKLNRAVDGNIYYPASYFSQPNKRFFKA